MPGREHSSALRACRACSAAHPLLVLGALLAGACASGGDEALTCDDLLAPEFATYSALAELVVEPGPKSCGSCHHTDAPLAGYNFEGRAVAYDALSTKTEIIYAQVASGEMPETGERWDAGDLRLLRSWYCYGAFYEE